MLYPEDIRKAGATGVQYRQGGARLPEKEFFLAHAILFYYFFRVSRTLVLSGALPNISVYRAWQVGSREEHRFHGPKRRPCCNRPKYGEIRRR